MITASEKPKEVTQYWSCCGYAAWKGELKCNEGCVKTGVRMVRATDFDTLTRDLERAQQTLEARGCRINELLEAQIAAARETADLRREVEGMRDTLNNALTRLPISTNSFENYASLRNAVVIALAASRKGE